jgi:hypothetical protein
MTETPDWTIQLTFREDEDKTRADALMTLGPRVLHGWGRARRNPVDPDVPQVGEELAAARALSHLSAQLLDLAADTISDFEGRPVHLHR